MVNQHAVEALNLGEGFYKPILLFWGELWICSRYVSLDSVLVGACSMELGRNMEAERSSIYPWALS